MQQFSPVKKHMMYTGNLALPNPALYENQVAPCFLLMRRLGGDTGCDTCGTKMKWSTSTTHVNRLHVYDDTWPTFAMSATWCVQDPPSKRQNQNTVKSTNPKRMLSVTN